MCPPERRKSGLVGLAVTVGLVAVASGALMRFGSLRPDNLLGSTFYAGVFSVHAYAAMASLAAMLVFFARGAVLRSWEGGFFAVAAIGQALAWAGAIFGWADVGGAALFPLVVAVIVAPVLETAWRGRAVVAAIAYLLARSGVRFFGIQLLVIVELGAGIALFVIVLASMRRTVFGAPRRLRALEAGLFFQGVLLTSFLGLVGDSAHLRDTLFPVGAVHLEACVLLFALGRNVVAGRTPSWRRTVALLVAAAAAHVFCWATVVVGARGMPRRYASYLPLFAESQAVTSIAALTFAVALIAVLFPPLSSRIAPRAQLP